MEFKRATEGDLTGILQLYDEAIQFQKTVFDKHWLGFDRSLVSSEIANGLLWKVIDDNEIACIFSTAYEDPLIWGPTSLDRALYLHRIVTSSAFRGRGYVRSIVSWAIAFARDSGLRFVRMDTWADNQKLNDYYQACGFKFVGLVTPPESDVLPSHYRGISLGLFEMDLEK